MTYDGSTIIRDQNNNPIPQQWDDENQEWKAYGEIPTEVKQTGSKVEEIEEETFVIEANGSSGTQTTGHIRKYPYYTISARSDENLDFSVSTRFSLFGGGATDYISGWETIFQSDGGIGSSEFLEYRGRLLYRISNLEDEEIEVTVQINGVK